MEHRLAILIVHIKSFRNIGGGNLIESAKVEFLG
jgi:hypothetical protein